MLRKLIYDPTEELPEDIIVAMFNVYKIYRSKKVEHVALRGISLSIHKNEIVSCVGPSGSGKSTLLNILGGLMQPTSGTIYWEPLKSDIARFSISELAEVRNKFLGYITQTPYLIPHLSVLKNVMFAGLINDKGIKGRKLKEDALELLDEVGLTPKRSMSPNKLSGGEVQRVALASALINKPHIILADEPTGNLDFETSEKYLDLITEINDTYETGFFIVTHSSQVAKKADRILELNDGMLIAHHTVANLSALDQTRVIIPDAQNRIFLPDELLKIIGNPWGYYVSLDNSSVVLKPVESVSEIESQIEFQEISCQLCNTKNHPKNRFCENCGSFLTQADFFMEDH